MKSNIRNFIHELQGYQSQSNVFNPWRDYDESIDMYPEAPDIRSKQMEQFLASRIPRAKYLFVAEAVGYQGGRFTGIALTSERILLGHHKDIKPFDILQDVQGIRTSNPDHKQLKNTQKSLGFTEPTATIVWGEVIKNRISPHQIITWNIFPFHPFDVKKGPLSNRTPTIEELEVGAYYTKTLLKMCPEINVIAIGSHAAKKLSKLGIKNIHVPHPANGGATKFRSALKKVIKNKDDSINAADKGL